MAAAVSSLRERQNTTDCQKPTPPDIRTVGGGEGTA